MKNNKLTSKENGKYTMLEDDVIDYFGTKLYRIKALKDFGSIKKGQLGGYIGKEKNLSFYDECWIYDNSKVFENARIFDNVKISGKVEIHGNVRITQKVEISGNIEIYGNAYMFRKAKINNSNQWYCIENAHERNYSITFFETDGIIYVAEIDPFMGLTFTGTLLEFERIIEESIYKKEYKICIELAKLKLLKNVDN